MYMCIYLDIRLDMDKPLTFGLEWPPTGGSKGGQLKESWWIAVDMFVLHGIDAGTDQDTKADTIDI